MAWLNEHPPVRSQFRHPRREPASGVIVLHSAENMPDLNPPDTGAEAVAKFIQTRTDPGSYHVICDADSRIRLVDFGDEAYQDGTGSNPHAIAISGAFRADQWLTLPKWWQDGVVQQMALAALEARSWLADRGVVLPAQPVTRVESDQRVPGFITHALRDPTRRSDPGATCAHLVVERYGQFITPTATIQGDDVATVMLFRAQGDPKVYAFDGELLTFQLMVNEARLADYRTLWAEAGTTVLPPITPGNPQGVRVISPEQLAAMLA